MIATMKKIKALKSGHLILKKVLLLFAIYSTMVLGPAVFAIIYFIQANRFQEKALIDLQKEEATKNLTVQIKKPNIENNEDMVSHILSIDPPQVNPESPTNNIKRDLIDILSEESVEGAKEEKGHPVVISGEQ